MAVDKATNLILCAAQTQGRCHDFNLFKQSKTRLHPKTKALTDTGYLGLKKLHDDTDMPKKRSKHHPLTKEDKAANRTLSGKRASCEHVIGAVKRFKILSDRYRNRRKRFGLRFSLIAGLYNANLAV